MKIPERPPIWRDFERGIFMVRVWTSRWKLRIVNNEIIGIYRYLRVNGGWLFIRIFPSLPDLFPVYGAWVIGAERYERPIGCRIVYTAPLDAADIIVIPVHEMHGADEESIPVELP